MGICRHLEQTKSQKYHATLRHRYTVDSRISVVLEFLEGTLSDVIKAAGRSSYSLTVREKADLAAGLLAGVIALHQTKPIPIYHGSITVRSIFVSTEMIPKIGFNDNALQTSPQPQPVSPAEFDFHLLAQTLKALFSDMKTDSDLAVWPEFENIVDALTTTEEAAGYDRLNYALSKLESTVFQASKYQSSQRRLVKGKRSGSAHVELVERPWQFLPHQFGDS